MQKTTVSFSRMINKKGGNDLPGPGVGSSSTRIWCFNLSIFQQIHQAITDHKKSLNEAVSDLQILLDKRSQYLTPEQARNIRDAISRLSAGYDSVYDVSSNNLSSVKSEIEKEKHRQKENVSFLKFTIYNFFTFFT